MKILVFSLILLTLLGLSSASPALSGLNIITDKESYVPNETVRIQSLVVYGPENPAYGAHVSISISNPGGVSVFNSSCSTNEEGMCYINFTISYNDWGEWTISGITELSGSSVNNEVYFDLHQEVCGDGVCDINEPDYCEQDCGKKDGEICGGNYECYSEICCHGVCEASCPFCGDGYCDQGESCPPDCGEDLETLMENIFPGGGIFADFGMRIYSNVYFEARQNSLVEFQVIVENLRNKTQENVTIHIRGVSSFSKYPEAQQIQPLSNKTFAVSIPILAGEETGEKIIGLMAVSNTTASSMQEIALNILEAAFDSSAACSTGYCEGTCCEGYVCCEGVCRTSCPVCGDGVCSPGENCLCSDCGPCQDSEIIGDKTAAEQAIERAQSAIQSSFVFMFRGMLSDSETILGQAREMFVNLDYGAAAILAKESLDRTNQTQTYEFLAYGSAVFLVFALFLINKFYKSQKQSKKHGKGGGKRKHRN
jgi:hypothetical protein